MTFCRKAAFQKKAKSFVGDAHQTPLLLHGKHAGGCTVYPQSPEQMAAPVRTMLPQLALALRHRSRCQFVCKSWCGAREGAKPLKRRLDTGTGDSQHPPPGHILILSLFLYFWPNKAAICLLCTLRPFIFHRGGIVKLCLFYPKTFYSSGPRAAGPRPGLSAVTHFAHLAPPSLNKHSMFD